MCLIYYLCLRIPGTPLLPARVICGELGQPSFEVDALDPHQPVLIGIPQRVGFPVIEHKRSLVSPAGRYQRQRPAVDFAAVHSRQINQRSVGGRNRLISKMTVGDFVPI